MLEGHMYQLGFVCDNLEEAIAYLRDSAVVARQVLDAAALRAAHPPHARQPVLTAADVPDALALVRAADLLDPLADVMTEPLSALRRHDTDHGTAFIDTVAAVLDHPGNLTGAARELGIHANSLRYRLDRIRVVSDIDLQSPAARLRAALGLLVWERRAGRSPVEIDKKPGSG